MNLRLPVSACLKLTCAAILAALALAVPASAQDWAKAILDKSPRHQEWVKVTHGSRTIDAFIVYPEVSHKAPVVLLVH
jgi:carboxymethylenebutenolidase